MFCIFGDPVDCPIVIGSYVSRISEDPSGFVFHSLPDSDVGVLSGL
ncbi:hypothetical protein HV356_04315 [Citrobacter sp. RHBSTW-01065]|nr:hypothetical protein [Citrobacter sp. RHBSTW-01065]